MELKNKVLRLSYLTPAEIAIRLNLHIDEVNEYLKKDTHSPEDIARIFASNPTMTAKDIASMLGCSYQYVTRSLNQVGIDFKQRTKKMKLLKEKQLEKQILKLYHQNKSVKEISEALGVAPYVIKKLADRLNLDLKMMKVRKKEEHLKYAIKARKEGKSVQEIADKLGLSVNYVHVMLSEARKQGADIPYIRAKK